MNFYCFKMNILLFYTYIKPSSHLWRALCWLWCNLASAEGSCVVCSVACCAMMDLSCVSEVVDFDKTNWLNSTCNCPVFFKKYICKHICAIAISMSLYIPPPRAKATPFKKCRKRGRPAQVSTALNYWLFI